MKRIIALFLLIGTATTLMLISTEESTSHSKSNFTDYNLISHAMGGIQNQDYTNSYEAFVTNYEQGNRVFEVDFMMTEDNQVVARHEWTQSMTKYLQQEDQLPEDRQAVQLTHQEFKDTDILGKLTPLDWSDVLDLMEEYPDIYIVTDTKEQNPTELLRVMVKEAEHRNPELLKRLIPQIYNQPMLKPVQGVYEFPNIIYTLYTSKNSDQEVIDFVHKNQITGVTMPESRVNNAFVTNLNQEGVVTYVHTINDIALMKKYNRMGIDGFYTDYITQVSLETNKRWYALGLK